MTVSVSANKPVNDVKVINGGEGATRSVKSHAGRFVIEAASV